MSGISLATRQIVLLRDGHRCVRCAADLMHGSFYSIHHRRPRMMGGSSDPRVDDLRNLVTLCGSGTTGCHGWVERNRNEAREQGWLLSTFEHLDRAMTTRYGASVTLLADGGVRVVRPDRRRTP